MSDDNSPTGLQYLRIDGAALDYYPEQIRRAAELLGAYVDGVTAGLLAEPPKAAETEAVPAQPDDDLRGAMNRLAVAVNAAESRGRPSGNVSICGPIFGADGGSGAVGSDREVLVVWGPGATAIVQQLQRG